MKLSAAAATAPPAQRRTVVLTNGCVSTPPTAPRAAKAAAAAPMGAVQPARLGKQLPIASAAVRREKAASEAAFVQQLATDHPSEESAASDATQGPSSAAAEVCTEGARPLELVAKKDDLQQRGISVGDSVRRLVVCDLSRYKMNEVGLRWRNAQEIEAGVGERLCGGVGCRTQQKLMDTSAALTLLQQQIAALRRERGLPDMDFLEAKVAECKKEAQAAAARLEKQKDAAAAAAAEASAGFSSR
ncbi:hypothetical protein cyc_07893 [Cyclospora cayetanensis]|uniref:Uncharacterized protein n=1 Tax=Cyclospora cayetanensis TaxID=88456 RepID=A0A1D3D0K3_9EIME|nr:hypothetical protein cyc_07893 [Cyclospora cayetanensis]